MSRYRDDPEYREATLARARAKFDEIKSDPVKYEAHLCKLKENHKKRQMKKKEGQELDEWWASLKVEDKIRIANKAAGEKRVIATPPQATILWLGLKVEEKRKIREHCEEKHGNVQQEWTEGKSFSY